MVLYYFDVLFALLSIILGLVLGARIVLVLVRLLRLYRVFRVRDDLADDWEI